MTFSFLYQLHRFCYQPRLSPNHNIGRKSGVYSLSGQTVMKLYFPFSPFQFGKKTLCTLPLANNQVCISGKRKLYFPFIPFQFEKNDIVYPTPGKKSGVYQWQENQVCISGTEKLWQTKSFSELGESWHTQMNCSIIIIIVIIIIIIIIIIISIISNYFFTSLWLRWLLLTQLLTINKSNRWWGIRAICVLFSVYSVFVRIMISFDLINLMIYIMSQVTMNIMITMMIYIIMVSV